MSRTTLITPRHALSRVEHFKRQRALSKPASGASKRIRPVQATAVYLLVRRDRRAFKVGWAHRPAARARALPEYPRELDLLASREIWLPSRQRAEQVERSLHKTLAPFHRPARHGGTGCQEWFDIAGHATALRLLEQMPLDAGRGEVSRLIPLGSRDRTQPPQAESELQALWCRAEDLWMKLVLYVPVTVIEREGEDIQLIFHGVKQLADHPLVGPLRAAALDTDQYQWWHKGKPWSLVQWINFAEDGLVVQLTSPLVIETWQIGDFDGEALAWQVRAFVLRLRRQGDLL